MLEDGQCGRKELYGFSSPWEALGIPPHPAVRKSMSPALGSLVRMQRLESGRYSGGPGRMARLGQRDGAVVKSDGYSSQGPGLDSQHLHGSSPIPEDRMPSSGTPYIDTNRGKTLFYIE